MDPSGEGWLLVFCGGVDLPNISDAGMMLQSFLGVGGNIPPFLWRVMVFTLCAGNYCQETATPHT